MDTEIIAGIEVEEQPKTEEKVVSITRKPYSTWTVGDTEYKLKLRASEITRLEERFKENLLIVVTGGDGFPPLATMLTIIQASMQAFHHGMTFGKVQAAFDQYVDEGGDQMKLMAEVVMPLLAVSGFFTETQKEALTESMREMETPI